MNKLQGEIASISTEGNLSMVGILYRNILLKTIIIEKPGSVPYLRTGNKINILFKETEVVIGHDTDHKISLQNRIPCTIIKIERGKLLSKIILSCFSEEIVSVISTHAVEQLNLSIGKNVIAMIKTNEIMLSE